MKQQRTFILSGIFFILWVFLDLFHVKQIGIGLYQAFKWSELISLTILLSLGAFKNIRRGFFIIFLAGIIESVIGILQFHVQHGINLGLLGEFVPSAGSPGSATIDLGTQKILRAYGTFPHPNVFASFLLISLIFGLYLFVSYGTSIKTRVSYSLGILFLLIGVFLSFSRISWLLSAISCFIFMFHVRTSKKWLYLLATGLISCGTIVGLWNSLIFIRIRNITNSNSYIDRGTFNNYAFEIIKKLPLRGSGTGNYIPKMLEMFHVQPWQYQPAHNIFLYICASLGFIGLILFINFLWQSLRSIWNSPYSDLKFTLLVVLFALLFMSNFDHFLVTIQQGQLLFFTCVGLLAGYKNFQTQDAIST